jgi:hypothetical protein
MADHLPKQPETAVVGVGTSPVPVGPGTAAPAGANGPPTDARAGVEEVEIEWDEKIENPPPRAAQKVSVQFVQGGWRPIAIPDDPQD